MRSFGTILQVCGLYADLPRQPDPEIVDALVPSLREGTLRDAERNLLVDQHTRLMLSRAFKYRTRFDFDDLVQAMLLDLVELIKFEAPTRLTDNNLTAWLCNTLEYKMLDYLHANKRGVKVSVRTERRRVGSLPGFSSEHLTAEACSVASDAEVVDVIDFCQHLARSEREKQTLNLLIEGYTQAEISERINHSQSTIAFTIEKLRDRYLRCA